MISLTAGSGEFQSFYPVISCLQVVHADLKPGNVVICNDHQLKLIDFGSAQRLKLEGSPQKLELMQGVHSTPGYQAPETLLDDPYDGPPVDVWSLGVVLLEMVHGKIPKVGRTMVITMVKTHKVGSRTNPTGM